MFVGKQEVIYFGQERNIACVLHFEQRHLELSGTKIQKLRILERDHRTGEIQ